MSGDVQPRKRKDKKKKKDELGIEEPRGTAAVFGEGDVFIHSYDEHGTGGHWCAKIIFFSLLAVLVTLIGLIILENRGLSELEANAVESRYSGVLEGWIEDDHHDEHTLELNHPDNLHEDEDEEIEHDEHSDDEDEHNEHDEDEDEHEEHDDDDNEDEDEEHYDDDNVDEDEEHGDDDNEDEDEVQQNSEENEDEIDEEDNADIAYSAYKRYEEQNNAVNDESGEDDERDDYKNEESYDGGDDDDNEYEPNENDEKSEIQHDLDEIDNDDDADEKWEQEEEHAEEDDDDDDNEEVESLEKEVSDEDILSTEVDEEDQTGDDNDDGDEEENDNQSDDDEPPVERITIPPPGKPYDEIEEESIQKTPDTLADEEEYERQQEELKREREAQPSHGMWLKLLVGGALIAATHAVVRRATAPRDEPEEEHINEEPSEIERRMTLIPETQEIPEIVRQVRPQEEIVQKTSSTIQSVPLPKPKPEVDKGVNVAKEEIDKKQEKGSKTEIEKELYSDEEEEEEEIDEDEEEEEEEVKVVIKKPDIKETKAVPINKPKPVEEPPEEDEDVEIIDDEEIEEELVDEEEDEVEEEISDVDDAELLSRLEAKYGRLPEPERPGRNKDGGNSIEEDWPGEPSDPYWSQQLDLAEEELRQGAWSSSERLASAPELRSSGRAQFILAKSLDLMAEAKRDNRLLSKAISAYLQLLKSNERLSDKRLVEVASRAIDRIQFRGTYLNTEPVYRLLIRRFPNNIHYRNNLTVSFLMANRADLAETVLKETLEAWPNDRIALAHYGFVLKNKYNKLEEAVIYLNKALEGDAGTANEPRFYYHLGDALLQLGRCEEARQVHIKGAELGHFLSAEQRSLYNVPRLKSRPWWPVEATPYRKLVKDLENSWKEILKEGLAAKDLYEKEKEGLKEKGEWSQLDLFVRGQEIPGRCERAPVTCSLVAKEPGARCRRGQIKFSSMDAGTHVRPHVGPTNCRLRMHLALSNTKDTFIRVGQEIRQWEVGKVFIFDDSFEHEVWHNGTGSRLVLIVDVWHPDLTPSERRTLPAI